MALSCHLTTGQCGEAWINDLKISVLYIAALTKSFIHKIQDMCLKPESSKYHYDQTRRAQGATVFFVQSPKAKKTSRPKARDGHRYPCPALEFLNGSSEVSRAAASEGTGRDEAL